MKRTIWAVSTSAALLLAACGSARRGVPLTGDHNPPNEEIALGQRVFDNNCSQCHPGGAAGLGPAINNKPMPRWLIHFQVRNGLGVMPAFSEQEISDEELAALSRYLKWLRGLDLREARR